jgi:hypothetical protein
MPIRTATVSPAFRLLFLLPVERVLAKNRVVLFQLEPIGGIPTVLGRVIPRCARGFGALEDDLDTIAFSHLSSVFDVQNDAKEDGPGP